ncbi:MAG: MBOAT family protein [Chitinivibrionales bacterium]|nr:MBOAT family protein [Chitinivibrionales bacterium]
MVFSSHIFLFYFLPVFLGIYFIMVWSKVGLSWTNLWITLASYIFYGWFEPWFVVLMWISTIVDYACGRAISWPEKMDPKHISGKDIKDELGAVNVFYPVFLGVGWLADVLIRPLKKPRPSAGAAALLVSMVSGIGAVGKVKPAVAGADDGGTVTPPDDTDERRRKFIRNAALVVSMVVNLGLLGFFKYYMFVMGGINNLAELLGAGSNLFYIMNIVLPIGISFYTFQTMSYTIDVWRGDAPPVKDMRTFSCFVALFPQLIAGPIIRYNTVAEQLATRKHSLNIFTSGATIFMLGFAKKILLADAVAPVADAAFNADAPNMLTAWWGILAYHFQIYFDFCAYSDMAVGLGRMMGFEFIKNFNAPYHAVGISDFWTRWHISLSTWIRDYLYIGLGGNRVAKARMYFNLGVSMFLCGVWHGAKMTFIVWGVFHGVLLIWERTMGRQPIYRGLPKLPKILLTNIIVLFGWVVFRAPSMHHAMGFWGSMLGANAADPAAGVLQAQLFSPNHVAEMLLCAVFVWQPFQAHEWVSRLSPMKLLIVLLLFAYAIVGMFTNAFSPFLYFQF